MIGRIRQNRGFTLLELMIAMFIVIILLSVALPTYQRSVQYAKETVLKENLWQMRKAIDQYASDKGKYPPSIDSLVEGKYLREMPIDPILSVLVSVLILRGAWILIRRSSHILLQGVPEGIDAARIGAALGDIQGVTDVHDVHAWSLTNERPIVTLHAVMEQGADQGAILHDIHVVLKNRFGIEHATVQLEYNALDCVPCEKI